MKMVYEEVVEKRIYPRRSIPLTQEDSLLVSYRQFFDMGFVNKKEYQNALRKLRAERQRAFIREYHDERWEL